MARRRQKKNTVSTSRVLGLIDNKYSGKLMAAKYTSYGTLFFLLLLLLPNIGLPKGLLGVHTSSGNISVTARVDGPPPTTKPTIDSPLAGTYDHRSATVTGTCEFDRTVKLFSNNTFIGSSYCDIGAIYSIQVTLAPGNNIIKAVHYDNLDQAGPNSDIVIIFIKLPAPPVPNRDQTPASLNNPTTYPSAQIDYSHRNIDPNTESDWALRIINGTAPYKLVINWGDDQIETMKVDDSNPISIHHNYKKPGNYTIKIRITDSDGNISLIQISVTVNGPIAKPRPIGATVADNNDPCDNTSNFWSVFGSTTCQSSPVYKMVPVYWAGMGIIGLLWIGQLAGHAVAGSFSSFIRFLKP